MGLFTKPACKASAYDTEGGLLTCGDRRRTRADWPVDLRSHSGDEHFDLGRRLYWHINPLTGLGQITGVEGRL